MQPVNSVWGGGGSCQERSLLNNIFFLHEFGHVFTHAEATLLFKVYISGDG